MLVLYFSILTGIIPVGVIRILPAMTTLIMSLIIFIILPFLYLLDKSAITQCDVQQLLILAILTLVKHGVHVAQIAHHSLH